MAFSRRITPSVRNFAEQRLGPGASGAVHPRASLHGALQALVGPQRTPGHGIDGGDAGHGVDLRHQAAQPVAVSAGFLIAPPHGEHSGTGEQRLRVTRIARQDPIEIRECRIEFVPALPDRRAQHQHRDRCCRVRPPGSERRLGVTEETRIAFQARGAEVRRRENRSPRHILRRQRGRGTQGLQLAELRRVRARKVLQHLRIIGGNVGRGGGRDCEHQRRAARREAQRSPHPFATGMRARLRQAAVASKHRALAGATKVPTARRDCPPDRSRHSLRGGGSFHHRVWAGTGSFARCRSR